MSHKEGLINLIRKTQTIISILLFFIVSLFCWKVTGLDVKEIQISHWGSSDMEWGWLWNGVIMSMSISIIFNNLLFIKNHMRLKNKKILYVLFTVVGCCLFMVGVFNVEWGLLHNVPAWIYFFLYPLSIFVMAYLNRTFLLYKEWFTHLIFSVSTIIIPLTTITMFDGFAIPEIIHSSLISLWNIYIVFRTFDVTN